MATTTTIKQLSDKSGGLISPFTAEAAVYDANGKRLNVKLDELQQAHDDNLEKIEKLLDSVFPINVSFSASTNSSCDTDTLQWSVTENGKTFSPDTVSIFKNSETIYDGKESSGKITTEVHSNILSYKITAAKEGRTSASRSTTRYVVHYGASESESVNDSTLSDLIVGLTHTITTGSSFNAKIKTGTGQYIWIIVPSNLNISKVTSDGFEVTLSSDVKTISYVGDNYSGKYKCYRTLNALSENTWNLVVS
jgi:hypothetical protein